MRRVSRIFILTILLSTQVIGMSMAAIVPQNGVAYVLIPKEVPGDIHGVYRLNKYSDPYDPITDESGRIIFDLNFGGAVVVNGLAVNQKNQIYLFVGPHASGEYSPVEEVGWMPSGRFDEDSPAYIKLIGQPFSADQVSQDVPSDGTPQRQYEHGTTNYDNDFWDYGWETWPYTHARYLKGPFTDETGKSYMYKFDPYNPATHQNLPLWNGPGPGSAGIQHPTDPYKVILPNKWGGISWYAFGSPNAPAAHVGKLMNGKDGRPLLDQHDFRLSHTNRGNYSPYGDAKYISTVVRRVYEKRDRSLDLYAYRDDTIPPLSPPYIYPYKETANVLTATDLKITEQYGKSCADGCIPGGALNPEAIGKIESCVQVFTSTTGRRYGYNPYGTKSPPYGPNDAALRVVINDASYNLNINSANIKNIGYFDSLGVSLESATIMGVSSNFAAPAVPPTIAPDHIYASIADKFCIQDSWWGNGGVAYEYFAKDTATDRMNFLEGHIYRLNYLETGNPDPEDVGYFEGDVDAIGVDGQGNLYVLTTELDCPNEPPWPDELGLPQGPDIDPEDPHAPGSSIQDEDDFLAVSSWFRPGAETSDYEIPSPAELGDYVKVYFKQNIRKVCRKYTPSAGGGFSLSTVEERGYVDSGFDAIRRDIVYDGSGGYTWRDLWRHDFGIGSRSANIDAEFAVVNIAERPSNIENDIKYSFCRAPDERFSEIISSKTPIEEDTPVTFKIEGYRPYGADGNVQHLVNVGAIPGIGDNVYVNIIPPYENRDEDGDGFSGSFPSGMFETEGAPYTFDVTWHVDLIDPRAGSDYTEAQVIKKWTYPDPEIKLKPGKEKLLEFTFPDPGTYAVYATFKYQVFKYEDLAPGDRPDKLVNHIETRNISSSQVQKILYHVQSSFDTLGDEYITNITLDTSSIFEENVNSAGQSDYGIIEDTSPASLSFAFDAQFVRDANLRLDAADFSTFNGIGVWDYGDPPHVYNWNPDGTVNENEYNPGRKKFLNEAEPYRFKCGTVVDEAPNEKDLEHITYRLWIYPPYHDSNDNLITDYPVEYATGTCKNAEVSEIGAPGEQKFRIEVNIPPENIKKIRTPIDPYKYKVRLELEYPRVTWQEVSHKDATGLTEAQYRSLIPDSPLRGLITNEPESEGGDDVGKVDTEGLFVGDRDYWEICARDVTIIKPDFEDIIINEDAEMTQIATHTTGDPVSPCKIKIRLEDNNPNAYYANLKLNYELPVEKRNLRDKTDGHPAPGVPDDTFGPQPNYPEFFATDSYRIGTTYTFVVPEYGGETGESELFSPGKTFQHWIGSLSFSLEGELYDGLGATQTNDIATPHHLKKDADDERLRTYACGLIRYDNDPPSVRVNLVSQADNRRWEITLKESNTDLESNPATLGGLATSSLKITCYKIKEAEVVNEAEIEVPGSSNFPAVLNDQQEVDLREAVDAALIATLPTVRRSSRLMVSLGIADNVDYINLASASVEMISHPTGTPLLPVKALKTVANPEDNFEASLQYDRGRYYVDMPMQVLSDQSLPGNPQVTARVYVCDDSGNERTLIIPIRISESSFNTRVLESSENR